MIGSILAAIVDGIISAGIKWLQGIQQRRADKQAGREEQRTADDEATIKEATDAAHVRDQVQAEPDADVTADLERLRNSHAASGDR